MSIDWQINRFHNSANGFILILGFDIVVGPNPAGLMRIFNIFREIGLFSEIGIKKLSGSTPISLPKNLEEPEFIFIFATQMLTGLNIFGPWVKNQLKFVKSNSLTC